MADITKLSRLVSGVQRQVDLSTNALHVDSLKVGSTAPVELTKAILTNLATLQDGSDFATGTNAHTHDGRYYTETELDAGQLDNRYFTETEHIDTSAGAGDAGKPIKLDAGGKIDGSMIDSSDVDHGSLTGLADDDHTQYHNDTRGDARYHKKTDLASTSNALGASLIGIEDASTQFTGTTVEAALDEAMDAAQAAQADIDAHTDGGASKHDATEIDYERVDGSKKNIDAASDEVEAALTDLDDAIGAMVQGTNYTATSAAIAADHLAGIDSALGTLSSTISNFEWQPSAADYITDNTAAPPTESTGHRYILSHDGGAPNAAWDGASAGDIVEFNGTTWDATTPTNGTFIAADDDDSGLYLWGGTSYSFKSFEATTASTGLTKVGFDIRIDASAAGTGLGFSAGVMSVNAGGGLETSGDQVQIAASAAGTGLSLTAGVLNVSLASFDTDDLSEGSTNLYFTEARVRATVLTGGDFTTNGTVSATDSVLSAAGKLQANQADLTTLSGAAQGATDLGTFTGSTIADNRTIKEALQDLETQVEAQDDASEITYTPSTLADWNSSTDPGETSDALDQLAERVKDVEETTANTEVVSASMVAGESLTGGAIRCVRFGITAAGETANRIYYADPTELSVGGKDPFHVIGLVNPAGLVNAGESTTVTKLGDFSWGGAHTKAEGEALYLGSGGIVTETIPSTSGEAIVKVAVASSSTNSDVQIQIMGVN